MDDELKFISGEFFDYSLPLDKLFIFKYFSSDLEKAFVKYYFTFGHIKYFSEHTGYRAKPKWILLLRKRLDHLLLIHKEAKRMMDTEMLQVIEDCKYEFVKTMLW